MGQKTGKGLECKRDVWTESWRMRNIYFCSEGKLFQGEGGACSKPWNCDGDLISQGNHEHPHRWHLSRTSQTSVPHVATGLHRQWPCQSQGQARRSWAVFTHLPQCIMGKSLSNVTWTHRKKDGGGWTRTLGWGQIVKGCVGPTRRSSDSFVSISGCSSVTGHCGDRRYGSSSRLAVGILFCYLSNSAICFLSPNNNLMLLALLTDLFHTSLAKIMPCWNYTVETCSCEVCFELAKGDSLRRNDLKALIVKHQLFWYLPKFCAVSCDWCEKNQYMGKLCFDQHKLNLSISPLYFLFPAFPIYYISLHIRGLRIPQQWG